MIKSRILRQPKHIILFSLFALLLYMGHQTGFISILSIFCLLVLLIIPFNRYIDTLGVLLLAFTGCFTVIGLLSGFVDSLSAAIAYFIPSIFFYCFGKYIVDILESDEQFFVVILAAIALYSYELYMTTIESAISTGSLVNTSRLFYIDGDEGRKLTATLVGLGVSLGFTGLPMSILYKGKKIVRGVFFIVFTYYYTFSKSNRFSYLRINPSNYSYVLLWNRYSSITCNFNFVSNYLLDFTKTRYYKSRDL